MLMPNLFDGASALARAAALAAVLLLGIWLILNGLLPLLNMKLSTTVTTGLAVLGIVAGILILLRR